MAKKTHSRAAMGPFKKVDKILRITYADQDGYIKEAMAQALKEGGQRRLISCLPIGCGKRPNTSWNMGIFHSHPQFDSPFVF
jgi:hypothetical protein